MSTFLAVLHALKLFFRELSNLNTSFPTGKGGRIPRLQRFKP
jgi:hypothetical protein